MDEPIRVLRVIARLNVGGPALHVSYLSSELDRIGYETTLVAGRVSEGEGSMEYVALERGVEPLFLPELRRDIELSADAVAVRRLVGLIRELRPHVLHTHTAKAGAVGRMAARLSGAARPPAVVHTFHGHVLKGYFSPAVTQVFIQLERRLAASTDALVAVSSGVRDDLVRLGVAPEHRIEVIPLGLDLGRRLEGEFGKRSELGIPTGAFVVGWFGRMTEIKRVDDLLRAFALLRARVPEAVLLLVGDGPLRGKLEQQARELGISAACRFVGYWEEVGGLYAACDAFALTSANEGTPVVILEALAAEVPVVATAVGGVPDVVQDGETGFLVAPGDVTALADHLQRLAREPDLRRRMGSAGRAWVLPRFSVERLVSDVDRLYRRLLERAPERRRPPRALPPTISRDRIGGTTERSLRIILVSQYFPPEVGATQSRMQAFAEYLALRGHKVTVIAEFPNHPQGVIPDRYRGRAFEIDRSNPYTVIRTWVKTDPDKTQATRLAFYLSFMALATGVAPLAGRADVVVATTPPLFTGLAGLAICRMFGAPFVLDVRDLWPAAATSLSQISPGWPTQIAEALERRLYRRAAAVVAVTRPFCQHVDALRGRGPATVLIPNATLDIFLEPAEPRRPSGVPDHAFLVTFAGTLGIAQALPTVLDAAKALDGSVHFAFVGDGPVKEGLIEQARREGLANVSFYPQVPLAEVTGILAASDALLVTLSGHPTFTSFVPSKMVDYMATGKPVVLCAAGESARLLDAAGAGVVVPPENAAALAKAVRAIQADPAGAAKMGQRGREFARKRMRAEQAARLEQVLLDVTRERV